MVRVCLDGSTVVAGAQCLDVFRQCGWCGLVRETGIGAIQVRGVHATGEAVERLMSSARPTLFNLHVLVYVVLLRSVRGPNRHT
jgi:hypothetical protein